MRKKQSLSVAALLLGLALPSAGRAQTIDFDNLTPGFGGSAVTNGYGGLNWANIYALNTISGNPFAPVTAASSPNVIFPGNGAPSSISVASGTFTLGSIDFIQWAPFLGALAPSTTVTGFNGATQLFQTVVPLGSSYATTVFNWSGVDLVTFDQSGAGWYVADNVVLGQVGGGPPTTTAPEPTTVGLLAAGLLGVAVRRARGRSA
jgi:hypothetical protein